jgi:dTDP-4-dehydrorhamnose 3,5-epimerase
MDFEPTAIPGVIVIRSGWFTDERGTFGRMFCRREFGGRGLVTDIAQSNVSHSLRRGTLRGFHIQVEPHEEIKLVQCVAGRIFDVALDLRRASPTFGRFHALELSAGDGCMLYIPEGCAHAYQTLEDHSTVIYHASAFYAPAAERGVRWNDPEIDVPWPSVHDVILSQRDRDLPLLAEYRAWD